MASHVRTIARLGLGCALLLSGLLLGPRLLDRTPPGLRLVEPPMGPVAGVLELHLEVDEPRGLSEAPLARLGERRWPATEGEGGWRFAIDTRALPAGAGSLVIEARDRALPVQTGQLELELVVDNDPPEVRIARRSLRVTQGEAVAVFLCADEESAQLALQVGDRRPALWALEEGPGPCWRAIVGFDIEHEAGVLPLEVEASDALGNRLVARQTLLVEEGVFPDGGFIRLPPRAQANQRNAERRAADRARRAHGYGHQRSEPGWGPAGFLRPVEGGWRSSAFGRMRTYNTGVRSYHRGVDIAAWLGTPIMASADATVSLAERLHINGNMVILSHGQGVFTSYSHLHRIDVEEGEAVRRGDVVGLVGDTGQATGAHLHWSVVVDGVSVDAEKFSQLDLSITDEDEFIPLRQAEAPGREGAPAGRAR